MPAGKLHRIKRKKRILGRISSGYKKSALRGASNFRKYKKYYKQNNGLNAQRPVTRRPFKLTALHQYQNTCSVKIDSWVQLAADGNNLTPTRNLKCLLQKFSINSPQVFDDASAYGPNVGNIPNKLIDPTNDVPRLVWNQDVADSWTSNGGATMMPGYDSAPALRQNFHHCQVLGAEYTFNIRAVDDTGSGELSTFIPMKIMLAPVSTLDGITTLDSTEDIMKMPFVQSRIICGTNGGGAAKGNTACKLTYKHSSRKYNGLPKGQFVGDTRYLASATLNQNVTFNATQLGNAPLEQDHLVLIFAPLSNTYSTNLANSCKTPRLHIEMKIKKWIKYTDPTQENEAVGAGTVTTVDTGI